MKGLFETRHTSSERSAPGISRQPGARRTIVGPSRRRSTNTICSGQLTYLVMHLCELTVSSSSIGSGLGISQRTTISDGQASKRWPSPERITPRAATSSYFPTHLAPQGDLGTELAFPDASLRPQRPSGSGRRNVCRPTSTKAHRSQGDPFLVMWRTRVWPAPLPRWTAPRPCVAGQVPGCGESRNITNLGPQHQPKDRPDAVQPLQALHDRIGQGLTGHVGTSPRRAAWSDRARLAASWSAPLSDAVASRCHRARLARRRFASDWSADCRGLGARATRAFAARRVCGMRSTSAGAGSIRAARESPVVVRKY